MTSVTSQRVRSARPQSPLRTRPYLSDGVGGATVGDLSSLGAIGGESGNDLGGVGDVGPGVGTGDGGENGSSGELHFD